MYAQLVMAHLKSDVSKQVFPRGSPARAKFIEISDFFFLDMSWQLSEEHQDVMGGKFLNSIETRSHNVKQK